MLDWLDVLLHVFLFGAVAHLLLERVRYRRREATTARLTHQAGFQLVLSHSGREGHVFVPSNQD